MLWEQTAAGDGLAKWWRGGGRRLPWNDPLCCCYCCAVCPLSPLYDATRNAAKLLLLVLVLVLLPLLWHPVEAVKLRPSPPVGFFVAGNSSPASLLAVVR